MKFITKSKIILIFSLMLLSLLSINSSAIEDPSKPFSIKKTSAKQLSLKTAPQDKDNVKKHDSNAKKSVKIEKKEPLSSPQIPLAQTISGILVVFGFIVVIVIIMKKYGKKLGIGNFANNIITVKARQQLDAKNSVSVIKVYEDEYVLGVGANGVTLLSKLTPIGESELFDNGETLENDAELQSLGLNDNQETNNAPFVSQLQSFIGNKKNNDKETTSRSTYSAKLDNSVNETVSLNISNQYNQQKDDNNEEN